MWCLANPFNEEKLDTLYMTAFINIVVVIVLLVSFAVLLIPKWIKRIPYNHVALMTFFGRRLSWWVKGEGLRFFFGYPLIFSYVDVDVTGKSHDFTQENVLTPDNAKNKIEIKLGLKPDISTGGALITLLNKGGVEGVVKLLQGDVSEEIRMWCRSQDQDPKTWQALQNSGPAALEVILKRMTGRDITKEEIKACGLGIASIELEGYGLILFQINIGNIEETSGLAEAAEQLAVEEQQQASQGKDTETRIENAQKIILAAKTRGEEMSLDRALQIERINRGLSRETVVSSKGSLIEAAALLSSKESIVSSDKK